MKLLRREFLGLGAGAAMLAPTSRLAWADNYPSRPVRLLVGFAAGAGAILNHEGLAEALAD